MLIALALLVTALVPARAADPPASLACPAEVPLPGGAYRLSSSTFNEASGAGDNNLWCYWKLPGTGQTPSFSLQHHWLASEPATTYRSCENLGWTSDVELRSRSGKAAFLIGGIGGPVDASDPAFSALMEARLPLAEALAAGCPQGSALAPEIPCPDSVATSAGELPRRSWLPPRGDASRSTWTLQCAYADSANRVAEVTLHWSSNPVVYPITFASCVQPGVATDARLESATSMARATWRASSASGADAATHLAIARALLPLAERLAGACPVVDCPLAGTVGAGDEWRLSSYVERPPGTLDSGAVETRRIECSYKPAGDAGTPVAFDVYWYSRNEGRLILGPCDSPIAPEARLVQSSGRQGIVQWGLPPAGYSARDFEGIARALLPLMEPPPVPCPAASSPSPATPSPPTPEPCPIAFATQSTARASEPPCPLPPLELAGRFSTVNRSNVQVPLAEAAVRVLVNESQVATTWTDADGRWSWTGGAFAPGTTFRAQVELRSRDGAIVTYLESTQEPIVRILSQPIAPRVPRAFVSVIVRADSERTDATKLVDDAGDLVTLPSPASLDALHDAALVYANALTARRFAESRLGLALDHELPVAFLVRSPEKGTTYDSSRAVVNVPALGGQSAFDLEEAPDNREFHEFGHHVHTDSAVSGENVYPALSDGDTNHGGANNSDTVDAFSEGFAEFYSALVRNDPVYRVGDATVDFEREKLGLPSGEEWNVASLLWDFYDPANERTDGLALGLAGTWALLNDPSVRSVGTLYDRAKALHGGAKLGSFAVDSVDVAFISHGFFADVNGSGRPDAGEPAGFSDVWRSRAAAGAPQSEWRRGGSLPAGSALLVEGADGVTAWRVRVEYDPEDGEAPPPREYVVGATGRPLVGASFPANAASVSWTPVAPGFEGKPFTLERAEYEAKLAEAQASGADHFAEFALQLEPNGVAVPSGFAATPLADGRVRLAWAATGEVVLTRGAHHAPRSPTDGVVVYEGSGASIEDGGAEADGPAYWSLFARAADGRLSAPTSASATPTVPDPAASPSSSGDAPRAQPVDAPDLGVGGGGFLFGAAVVLVGIGALAAGAWLVSRRRR